MRAGWTLSLYFGRRYLLWFLVFLGGLTGIVYLLEVAELLRRAADMPHTTLGIVLAMGAYKMPDTIEKILPFVVLFAGMFTFWKLTRSHELIVARAAGVSAWQFIFPALAVTLAFGLVNLGLLNPLGAAMNARYKDMEQTYLNLTPSLELTGAVLWLRQTEGDTRYLIHADKVQMQPLILTPVILFMYDADNHYRGRIDAPEAVLDNGAWRVRDAWVNIEDQPPRHEDAITLGTDLTAHKIQESMAPPNTISFWHLPAFADALKTIGLPPGRHWLEFQRLLAQPFLLCAMVFFAAAFSLRFDRRGGILNAAMAGMAIGSVVYSLGNLAAAMGANDTLPIALAAWAVPLAALASGPAALLYLEDG